MLSPPTLTGVSPAYTRALCTTDGARYDSGGFMWLGQEAMASTPSTVMRKRSSASPCTTGRLDTPPADCRATPGTSASSAAVSLVVGFLASRAAPWSVAEPRVRLRAEGAVTVTGASSGASVAGSSAQAEGSPAITRAMGVRE